MNKKYWNSRYLDQLDFLTQYEFIAAIFRMGLLKKVQVREWSHSRPQSLNHDPLEQSSVRLWDGTKTSCLGVPTRLPIIPAFFLNIHSERALHYLLRGLLSNQCQYVLALPLLPLNFQHSELEKRRLSLSWSVYPICLSMVMEVLDLSLLDISIWTWEWNASWWKTRASRDALFVRVWLWSECSGVVTDTLTLFRWF